MLYSYPSIQVGKALFALLPGSCWVIGFNKQRDRQNEFDNLANIIRITKFNLCYLYCMHGFLSIQYSKTLSIFEQSPNI